MGKTIGVCVDGSEIANGAFEYALNEIYKPGDTVIVLYAVEYNAAFGITESAVKKAMEVVATKDKEAESLTAKYAAKLREKSISGQALKFTGGKAGEALLGQCSKQGVTHIVMGTRGLGTIQRAILGSVSQYVINHSDIAVTIVHGSKS